MRSRILFARTGKLCSPWENLFFSRLADGGLPRVGREGRRGSVDSTLIIGSSSITGGRFGDKSDRLRAE